MTATIESNVPRHDIPTAGRSGFVLVDERQVHYLEWGRSGSPPVVCLHGGGQTAYMWEGLRRRPRCDASRPRARPADARGQ